MHVHACVRACVRARDGLFVHGVHRMRQLKKKKDTTSKSKQLCEVTVCRFPARELHIENVR